MKSVMDISSFPLSPCWLSWKLNYLCVSLDVVFVPLHQHHSLPLQPCLSGWALPLHPVPRLQPCLSGWALPVHS